MAFPASAIAAALWLFTSGATKEAAIAGEMEQLRGTWVLVEIHQNGNKLPPDWFRRVGLKSTFTKDGHYHTERTDYNSVDGVIAAIDPTRTPKTVDLLAERGSFREQTSFCIYE